MADMVLIVSYFAFLLGFGVIVANMMKKVEIPDAFFLLLVGLACGPTIWKHPAVAQYISITVVDVGAMGDIPDFLRTLALVLIVFSGSFNLSFKELKRFSEVSVNLAFIMVILNTVVLGLAAKFLFDLSYLSAFLIGAIISGTDASVVLAFESSLKKHKNILTILTVESILNSPLSILIPILLLDLVSLTPGTAVELNVYLSQLWQMVAAGIGSGFIIGIAVSKLLKNMLKEYSALLIVAIALLTYAFSELVGGSGMLAVAVAGFIIGNLAFPHKETVREFHGEFSDMLRISVFTLLGAQIALNLDPYLLAVEFAFALLVFFIRPIFVMYLARDMEGDTPPEGMLLLQFIAPRGISAAAIAPIAAVAMGNNLILDIVFVSVFFSILLSTILAHLVSSGRISWVEKEEEGEKVEEDEQTEEELTELSD